MRWWLLDLPVAIVDVWGRVAAVLIAIACLVTVPIVMITVLLAAIGIRWGW